MRNRSAAMASTATRGIEDITDEEYLAQLETKREEITHEILERCRTKRKNLYITGPVALKCRSKVLCTQAL